jgi:hypothetical protein
MEVSADQLRDVVEAQHGVPAQLVEAVPVAESFEGKPAWQGVVYVFSIQGHRSAGRCYAWSSPLEGSGRRRFYAVLGAADQLGR